MNKTQWQPIETAPKDGRAIILLSRAVPAKVAIGSWNADGDSWVDEHGQLTGECHHLEVIGTWSSGGGWFQPDEVTHWMPIPEGPE